MSSENNIGNDSRYSSGDNRETNNNEADIDKLTNGISKMGCVAGVVKKQNVIVESCVYQGSDEESRNDDDAYSDDFENKSEDENEEADSVGNIPDISKEIFDAGGDVTHRVQNCPSSMSTKSNSSTSRQSTTTTSRRSFYGSLPVPQTHRINMSFTNDRLREIERHNNILLSKIVRARNVTKSTIPAQKTPRKISDSCGSLQRKKQQRQIDYENMILLKKIQRVKSSSLSIRR